MQQGEVTHPRLQWKSVSKLTISTKLTWFPRISESALFGPNPFTVRLFLGRKDALFQVFSSTHLFLIIMTHPEAYRGEEDQGKLLRELCHWPHGRTWAHFFCSTVPQFPSHVRMDITPPCIVRLSNNLQVQSWEKLSGDSWSGVCVCVCVSCSELSYQQKAEVGEGLWRSFSSTPSSNRVSWNRLLKVLSSQHLNVSKDRNSLTSLSAPVFDHAESKKAFSRV